MLNSYVTRNAVIQGMDLAIKRIDRDVDQVLKTKPAHPSTRIAISQGLHVSLHEYSEQVATWSDSDNGLRYVDLLEERVRLMRKKEKLIDEAIIDTMDLIKDL